jgi:NADPH:quinone reductase-like Zn-dependent oxidoreductase
LAGIVDSIGEGVQDFVAGQSVLLSSRELPIRGGCYTEFIAVPATCAHALPAGVLLEQAVVLPSYVVAHASSDNMIDARFYGVRGRRVRARRTTVMPGASMQRWIISLAAVH